MRFHVTLLYIGRWLFCFALLVPFTAFFLQLSTFQRALKETFSSLSIVGFVFALGHASCRTTGGRNQGDDPRHQSWSGLLRHGGQCGGGRGEVHPRRGRLYYRWTVSHSTIFLFNDIKPSILNVTNWVRTNEICFLLSPEGSCKMIKMQKIIALIWYSRATAYQCMCYNKEKPGDWRLELVQAVWPWPCWFLFITQEHSCLSL